MASLNNYQQLVYKIKYRSYEITASKNFSIWRDKFAPWSLTFGHTLYVQRGPKR